MATENGDERQQRTLERIEARLERMDQNIAALSANVSTLADNQLRLAERLDLTREVLERQIARLRIELLAEMELIAKIEVGGRQPGIQAQRDELERRLSALETAG